MQTGFIIIVLLLMLVGAYVFAGVPGLALVAAALGVAALVDRAKQRRKERREAKADPKYEAPKGADDARTAPPTKAEASAPYGPQEAPEPRPGEPPGALQDAADEASEAACEGDLEAPSDDAPGEASPPADTERLYPLMKLGSWPQGPNGEREPIEWILLKQEEDRALALSLYILELRPFHTEAASIRWEASDLRGWLADDFFEAAFSPEEQDRICQPEPSEDPGGEMLWQMFGMETVTGEISDRVFALNASDLSEFFPGQMAMFHPGCTAEPTPWVLAQGAGEPAERSWWLRSSLRGVPMAYIASPANSMGVSAISPDNVNGVRPAVWLKKREGAAWI